MVLQQGPTMLACLMGLALAVPAVSLANPSPTAPVPAVSATAPQPPKSPMRITYDMSDLPLTILIDAKGTVAIEELPFPGEVIYQPSTATIFYRHPEEDEWLSIPPATLNGQLVAATLSGGGKGQAWQSHPTQNWEVKVGTLTCDQWSASASAAKQAGINIADILHILTAVQWLNGGSLPNACEKIGISAADAAKVGLPTLFTGPNGRWQLQELAPAEVAAIAIPKATPLTDETRLRLLLVQFSPEERANLLTKYANLSTAGQVEAISQLLSTESLP